MAASAFSLGSFFFSSSLSPTWPFPFRQIPRCSGRGRRFSSQSIVVLVALDGLVAEEGLLAVAGLLTGVVLDELVRQAAAVVLPLTGVLLLCVVLLDLFHKPWQGFGWQVTCRKSGSASKNSHFGPPPVLRSDFLASPMARFRRSNSRFVGGRFLWAMARLMLGDGGLGGVLLRRTWPAEILPGHVPVAFLGHKIRVFVVGPRLVGGGLRLRFSGLESGCGLFQDVLVGGLGLAVVSLIPGRRAGRAGKRAVRLQACRPRMRGSIASGRPLIFLFLFLRGLMS